MAKRASSQHDQPREALPATDSAAPTESAGIIPDGRHWLKYAGIGERRQKGYGGLPVSGENVTSLGSLEAEVLGLLWEIGRPATSMEVMEISLYKRRAQGREPASFATIATTLRRLTSKGLLSSWKNDARAPMYQPTVEREQMAARILNNVSLTLLGSSLHGLLPKLIGNSVQPAAKVSHANKYETNMHEANKHEAEQADWQRLLRALEEVAQVEDASGDE